MYYIFLLLPFLALLLNYQKHDRLHNGKFCWAYVQICLNPIKPNEPACSKSLTTGRYLLYSRIQELYDFSHGINRKYFIKLISCPLSVLLVFVASDRQWLPVPCRSPLTYGGTLLMTPLSLMTFDSIQSRTKKGTERGKKLW